jgi:hypothetical protein
MKIDPLSAQRLSPLRRGKRGESGAGEAFAAELEGEAAAPASVGAGSAATPVEALLALQEVPDALVGQGRAKRHGEALLDQLEQPWSAWPSWRRSSSSASRTPVWRRSWPRSSCARRSS